MNSNKYKKTIWLRMNECDVRRGEDGHCHLYAKCVCCQEPALVLVFKGEDIEFTTDVFAEFVIEKPRQQPWEAELKRTKPADQFRAQFDMSIHNTVLRAVKERRIGKLIPELLGTTHAIQLLMSWFTDDQGDQDNRMLMKQGFLIPDHSGSPRNWGIGRIRREDFEAIIAQAS